jgi:hypothetical protein
LADPRPEARLIAAPQTPGSKIACAFVEGIQQEKPTIGAPHHRQSTPETRQSQHPVAHVSRRLSLLDSGSFVEHIIPGVLH